MLPGMARSRSYRLAPIALLLGFLTSVGLAMGLAWVRPPINSYSGDVIGVVRPSRPIIIGGKTFDMYVLTWDEQGRFGERVYAWFSGAGVTDPEAPMPGRPDVYPAIDSFFEKEYIPDVAERTRPGYGICVVRTHGWPFRCLWEGETVDGMNNGLTVWPWNGLSYGGIKVGMSGPIPHYLPTRPMWPGLVGDTLLFGAGWFGLMFFAARARRARLRRRNLCLHCRYDLRGTPPGLPCPECGRAR